MVGLLCARNLVELMGPSRIPILDRVDFLTQVYGMTLLWLFPYRCASARANSTVRILCTFCAFVLGILDVLALAHTTTRLVARALPPPFQRFVLQKGVRPEDSAAFREYVRRVCTALWSCGADANAHFTYCEFLYRHYYWGEASPERTAPDHSTVAGEVQRHVEHLECMMCPNAQNANRTRYRVWRRYYPVFLRFVILFYGASARAREYETFLIRHQPSTIQSDRAHHQDLPSCGTHRRFRAFPVFRSFPTRARELQCNLYRRWRESRGGAILDMVSAGLDKLSLYPSAFLRKVRKAVVRKRIDS